jgi:uncharacterized membrane protein YvbJ
MALISCPDCNKEISENAPACPGCGAPIAGVKESAGSGVNNLATIQETSKKLKTQILIAAALFWGGLLLALVSSQISSGGDASLNMFAGLLAVGGLILYISTKARIWWHHK